MKERTLLFLMGGVGYCLLELAYCGHTHWTMFLAGGFALPFLRALALRFAARPFWVRCLLGAGAITGVELAFGLVFNRLLGWRVWDYSGQWGNLWGQICPLYSFFWLALSALLMALFAHWPPPPQKRPVEDGEPA